MTLTGLRIALLMVLTGHFWGLLIIAPLLGLAFDAIRPRERRADQGQ
jgi:hypothetical protein